ncbi:hypothetical protein AK812_SmicGene8705 [Symbiodinium microadriaticum]|uniref:Uncharacterized protein n=1 Tax=Symbiodinium microadriaticum TaxID=2951 RepID=A0A1Q9EK59_SYMMI|nr:hypothetical protein AK812_SmicGene8705 [Symbiodinium microadriaticum]
MAVEPFNIVVRNTFIDAVQEPEGRVLDDSPLNRTHSDPTGGYSKQVLNLDRIVPRAGIAEEEEVHDLPEPAFHRRMKQEEEEEAPLARTRSMGQPQPSASVLAGIGRTLSAASAGESLQRLLTGGGEDESFAAAMETVPPWVSNMGVPQPPWMYPPGPQAPASAMMPPRWSIDNLTVQTAVQTAAAQSAAQAAAARLSAAQVQVALELSKAKAEAAHAKTLAQASAEALAKAQASQPCGSCGMPCGYPSLTSASTAASPFRQELHRAGQEAGPPTHFSANQLCIGPPVGRRHSFHQAMKASSIAQASEVVEDKKKPASSRRLCLDDLTEDALQEYRARVSTARKSLAFDSEANGTGSTTTAATTVPSSRSICTAFSSENSQSQVSLQVSQSETEKRAEKAWLRARLRKARRRELLNEFLKQHSFSRDISEAQPPATCFPFFKRGETLYPIHVAARMGHTELVRILLEEGADRNQRTSGGRTALDIALSEDHRGSHCGVLDLLQDRTSVIDMHTAMKMMLTGKQTCDTQEVLEFKDADFASPACPAGRKHIEPPLRVERRAGRGRSQRQAVSGVVVVVDFQFQPAEWKLKKARTSASRSEYRKASAGEGPMLLRVLRIEGLTVLGAKPGNMPAGGPACETKGMGIVQPDFRQFTKVGYEGRLSVVSESQVHQDGLQRYLVQFTSGELSRADGVGFVFSQRLPCAKNIQRIVSIFVNQRGRICMRAFAELERASAFVKPLELGDCVEMAIDLTNQVCCFNIWECTDSGWPDLTGKPASSAELNFGARMSSLSQGAGNSSEDRDEPDADARRVTLQKVRCVMPVGRDAEVKSAFTKPGYQRRKTLPAVVSSKSEALSKTLATQRPKPFHRGGEGMAKEGDAIEGRAFGTRRRPVCALANERPAHACAL